MTALIVAIAAAKCSGINALMAIDLRDIGHYLVEWRWCISKIPAKEYLCCAHSTDATKMATHLHSPQACHWLKLELYLKRPRMAHPILTDSCQLSLLHVLDNQGSFLQASCLIF